MCGCYYGYVLLQLLDVDRCPDSPTVQDSLMALNGSHVSRCALFQLQEHDSGLYQCVAVNDAGYASASITLSIYHPGTAT